MVCGDARALPYSERPSDSIGNQGRVVDGNQIYPECAVLEFVQKVRRDFKSKSRLTNSRRPRDGYQPRLGNVELLYDTCCFICTANQRCWEGGKFVPVRTWTALQEDRWGPQWPSGRRRSLRAPQPLPPPGRHLS